MKSEGCSAQYAEYSTREVLERMKGGAVREERSPLKDAMDLRNEDQEVRLDAGTPDPTSFEFDMLQACCAGNVP